MAKLSITDAARVTGVSRVTLHRYIKAGKLSRSADGTVDTAELVNIRLTLFSLQKKRNFPEKAAIQ
jgi:DeoR/GlpR family transcriptional regulator of sugar metabolism